MGLYSDIPGRDPAEEAPKEYREAEGLLRRLRELASARQGVSRAAVGEAAEWALSALRPLRKEFFDHQGLQEWTSEAEELLRKEYEKANLPPSLLLNIETDCYPGLLEARLKLTEALRDPGTVSLAAAEAAFKHVLHHSPEVEPARRGLAIVKEQLAALDEQRDGLAKQRAQMLSERRGWPLERKLAALVELCQWPQVTAVGVCPRCCFRETETSTLASIESGGSSDQVRVTRPVGCAYRLRLVAPLLKLAEISGDAEVARMPEAAQLLKTFERATTSERAGLEGTISTLFELSLASLSSPSAS